MLLLVQRMLCPAHHHEPTLGLLHSDGWLPLVNWRCPVIAQQADFGLVALLLRLFAPLIEPLEALLRKGSDVRVGGKLGLEREWHRRAKETWTPWL